MASAPAVSASLASSIAWLVELDPAPAIPSTAAFGRLSHFWRRKMAASTYDETLRRLLVHECGYTKP
jgi:hypothetical protein